ncbi:MAG: glutamyl-tRNA reductase, partial [bacterium]|nr:glutamyl-tRNA reductase [bacterium]
MVRASDPEHFIVVTFNHRTLSLKDLHRYIIPSEAFAEFLASLIEHPAIEEVVGLSTCNRIEFYASVHSVKDAAHAIVYPLARRFGESLEELGPNLDVIVDAEGVEHLFRLVAGLESMVLGDAQILGQVKQAYKEARKRGYTQKIFNLLFQKAFANAKRVRTETGLGAGRVSVSAIAVEQALAHFGSLQAIAVTVIGAGKMGRLAVKYLRDAGVKDLRILNRSLERSQELAEETGFTAYPFEQMEACLCESQLIISGTAASEHVITQAMMERIGEESPASRLLIDIAVPPDIDPRVSELPGVVLADMEDLREQAHQYEAQRAQAIKLAEEITGE